MISFSLDREIATLRSCSEPSAPTNLSGLFRTKEKITISACVPSAPVVVKTLLSTSKCWRYFNIVRLCSVYLVTIEIDFEGATLFNSQQIRTQAFASTSLYHELGPAIISFPFRFTQVITSSGFRISTKFSSISYFASNLLPAISGDEFNPP